MKKVLGKIHLAALVLFAGLLLGSAAAQAEPMQVFVTIAPQQYFAQKLGGDLIKVNLMVPPGSNPHIFEPKPRQMAALSKARAYFAVGGMEFEEVWLPRFKAANSKLTIVETGHGFPRIAMAGKHEHKDHEGGHKEHAKEHDHAKEHGKEHGHHKEHAKEHDQGPHHEGMDPHIWTSPLAVKHMVENMLKALIKLDPANQAKYQENHRAFAAEVDSLHSELKETFAKLPGEPHLLVFHPAWGYFCKAYGLEQIAVEKEGKSPGPKGLQAIIKQAKQVGAKVIFVQPQFSEKSARMVAESIAGQVVPIDPLAVDWADNLRKVAKKVKQALR